MATTLSSYAVFHSRTGEITPRQSLGLRCREPNRGREVECHITAGERHGQKTENAGRVISRHPQRYLLCGKKILAALPKMAKAAQNADLKAAFEKHAGEADGAKEFIASGCPLGSLPSTCPGLEGRE
jgi:hypothetical protein